MIFLIRNSHFDLYYLYSNTTISELAEEKLVTIMPRRGIVVTQISLKDVEDMLNARALLEPYIFQNAFPNVEKDVLLRMKNQLNDMIAHKKVKMDSLEEDFDYSFHMYFAEKANNWSYVKI